MLDGGNSSHSPAADVCVEIRAVFISARFVQVLMALCVTARAMLTVTKSQEANLQVLLSVTSKDISIKFFQNFAYKFRGPCYACKSVMGLKGQIKGS